VSVTVQVAGLAGGGGRGPTKGGGVASATGAGAGARVAPESVGAKDTRVGPGAEEAGIAAERWERISKRSAISTMAPRRLPQNQIEGSNREFKKRPAG
tara:strand:- start:186 stop:479 length:294 start_codon:yes stop_codon:yes gene_type:complete